MRHVIEFAVLLMLVSCRQSRLEWALRQAGENSPELEKVLEHYSENPADSLKYRAAVFLIENMPGHYSFRADRIGEYYSAVEHLLDVRYPLEAHRDSIEQTVVRFPDMYQYVEADIKIVSADYLIHNIEISFEDWKRDQLTRHITFEQFCEYLLPYKVVDLQPLDYWKDTLSGRYSVQYRSLPWPVQMKYSMYHAANTINSALRDAVQERSIVSNTYPLLAASNIDRLPFGTCDDYAFLATAVMRSEGIPCFKEDIVWLQKRTGHSWYSVINNDGNTMLFKWGLSGWPEQTFFYDTPVPKVYRHTYSINRAVEDYQLHCPVQVIQKALFQKDVTSEYVSVSDVPVRIRDRNMKRHGWAYIAAFHDRRWEIMDFARIRNGRAVFRDMGRNVVYLIYGYDGENLRPLGAPFILQSDGSAKVLSPDFNNSRDVILTRKYPMDSHTYLMEQRMAGAKIEASKDSNFKEAVLIRELSTRDMRRFIQVDTTHRYRYWRYYGPAGSYCDIAEFELYKERNDVPVRGCRIIGTLQVHPALPQSTANKAFDGDWLTNFSCAMADNAWIGVDLGKPESIERIRCIPRSDDNSIHTGDEYELYYWNKVNWKSLGCHTGKVDTLTFRNVPDDALLLLRNHTRGQEERIFTYENGEQIWW